MEDRLGYDLTFELDKFSNPKLRTTSELIKNVLLYILFSKPGQYPSLPHIGLDLQTMLFSFYDDINEGRLKEMVVEQCEALGVFFSEGVINIRKLMYKNKPSLMIYIETDSGDSQMINQFQIDPERDSTVYKIGITFDELNEMVYHISEGI